MPERMAPLWIIAVPEPLMTGLGGPEAPARPSSGKCRPYRRRFDAAAASHSADLARLQRVRTQDSSWPGWSAHSVPGGRQHLPWAVEQEPLTWIALAPRLRADARPQPGGWSAGGQTARQRPTRKDLTSSQRRLTRMPHAYLGRCASRSDDVLPSWSTPPPPPPPPLYRKRAHVLLDQPRRAAHRLLIATIERRRLSGRATSRSAAMGVFKVRTSAFAGRLQHTALDQRMHSSSLRAALPTN